MIDTKELADTIITKMKEEHHIFWIDPEIHSTQHEFIQILIDERKEREARRARLKEKIAGSLILSGIIFIIGLIGAGFLNLIKVHLK